MYSTKNLKPKNQKKPAKQKSLKQPTEKEKKIESKRFLVAFKALNNHHKHIAFQTLLRMERDKKRPLRNKAVFNRIEEKKGELKIRYAKLGEEVDKRYQEKDEVYLQETYDKVFQRKSIKSKMFPYICDVLQLSKKEINAIQVLAQFDYQSSIECMFDSLSPKNQNAIFALVNLLSIEETSPDYFDLYPFDDEWE